MTIIITILVLLLPIISPLPLVRKVKGESRPNAHALLHVRYSLTRYWYPPEWKEGEIEIELYEKRAPITTTNFIQLAESGFYDGTLFHRVIKHFVIQGGDPNTKNNTGPQDWWDDGNGGSGKTIPLETCPELTHVDGAVGMAREYGDPNSASSQFYICDGPQHQLDDNEENNRNRTGPDKRGYAVFGITVRGIEIVREIASVWTTTDANIPAPYHNISAHVHDHPIYDVTLKSVTIIRYEAENNEKRISTVEIATAGILIFVMSSAVVYLFGKRGKLPSPLERIIHRKK